MNADRKHNYNGDFSVRRRSASPGLVGQSHSYQGQMASTVKSDLGTMVGPVYNMASAKHNFTGGYAAPKARPDQVDLVGKFFQKEQKEVVRQEQKSTFESTQTASFSSLTSSKVETKIESAGGEERRAEALARRQEFLKRKEEMRKQQEMMQAQREEMERQRLLKRQQEEEERLRQEKLRRESENQVSMTKTEIITRKEESNNMEEMKRMHEQKILERQRLEMMISQESK